MKDVQSQQDTRNVYLNRVGIKDLRFPINVAEKEGGHQPTVAKVALAVDLHETDRGTHMSRFVESMNTCGVIDPNDTRGFLLDMAERLKAEKAFMKMEFPFFVFKAAPVSGILSRLDLDCCILACVTHGVFDYELSVKVPVTTLCPCSKEISDYGAHNQRALVSVTIRASKKIWIEDLVSLVEACASSDIYSLLKRPDEKFVTERAYENPKFVEDVTRDVYMRLDAIKDIKSFEVEVESLESIHNHSAFASASRGREV